MGNSILTEKPDKKFFNLKKINYNKRPIRELCLKNYRGPAQFCRHPHRETKSDGERKAVPIYFYLSALTFPFLG